jgi:tetratricopeptide (TPR) repeat protein
VVAPRVGLTDVLPTLLALLGAEPPRSLPGRDLRPLLAGGPVAGPPLYAESLFGRLNCRWAPLRAITDGDYKLVVGAEGHEELFDLAADPAESRDLAREQPRRVQQMHAALRAALRAMAPEGDVLKPRAVSAEQEARLRSLGYVGGIGGAGAVDEKGLPDPRARVHVYERVQKAMGAQGEALAAALEDTTRLAAEDSGNPFVHMALGHLAYRGGRFGTAARAFSRAVELDPDRPAVRAPYGRLLRELGRLEESERHLRIAVEQSGGQDLGVALSLVDTLSARGQLAEAERQVDAVLARAPADAAARMAKARVLVAGGRADAVPPLVERAAAAPPDDWVALAEAYLSAGHPARARESAEHVLRRAPGHPWALAVAGHALALEGRRDAALALLRRGVAQGPRRPAAWRALAEGFAAAGDGPSAARCRRAADAVAAA